MYQQYLEYMYGHSLYMYGHSFIRIQKPVFHWKSRLRWLPYANEIDTNNMKCTCPTPAPHIGDPKPFIFYVLALGVCVGSNVNFSIGVGHDENFGICRYQHVGIPNAKLWHWGSKPTRGQNANGFASQWNIGLNL